MFDLRHLRHAAKGMDQTLRLPSCYDEHDPLYHFASPSNLTSMISVHDARRSTDGHQDALRLLDDIRVKVEPLMAFELPDAS